MSEPVLTGKPKQDAETAIGPTLEPITISLSGSHKSIGDLVWENVPPFALITGINGSGKSQLLEAIQLGSRAHTPYAKSTKETSITLSIEGDNIAHDEITSIPIHRQLSTPSPVGAAEIHSRAHGIWHNVSYNDNPMFWAAKKLATEILGSHPQTITADSFAELAFKNPGVFLHPDNLLQGVTELLVNYRGLLFQAIMNDHLTPKEAVDKLGTPPWTSLNTTLASINFPYRVVTPEDTQIFEQYSFRLCSIDGGLTLPVEDLSSGEKQLLSMVMWLFRTKYKALPRLLLLDEPDAFLHPSLTASFLAILVDVLVKQHGVRVIMTTHSPSTVALAPEGSIFEMRKKGSEPRLSVSESRWSTIGLLTSGLITVGADSKKVFVEAHADVHFYSKVFDLLKLSQPLSEAPATLRPAPSLVFIAATNGDTKKGDPTGGRTKVISLVAELEGTHTHGIVDMDQGTKPVSNRVHVLGRYEMENYLFDPVLVYANLASVNKAKKLTGGQEFTVGTVNAILDLPRAGLEEIRDMMLNPVRSKLSVDGVLSGGGDDTLVEVRYVNGSSYSLPRWFLQTKGKRMMGAFRQVHGNETTIEKLRLTLERTQWIPSELATLLKSIQDA